MPCGGIWLWHGVVLKEEMRITPMIIVIHNGDNTADVDESVLWSTDMTANQYLIWKYYKILQRN